MSEPFFSRWNFLTAPLDQLLAETGAVIVDVVHDDPDFMGRTVHGRPFRLELPAGQNDLEREGVARFFLAERIGLDVSDWPVAMNVTRCRTHTEETA